MTVAVPRPLHDILGEHQSRLELLIIGVVGLGLTAGLIAAHNEVLAGTAAWRAILAALLILDVSAGSVANLTRGTSRYYALRPRNRLVFIAVHIHLPLISWLLEDPLAPAVAVWAYTIAAALAVNRLHRSPLQPVIGGVALTLGAVLVVILAPELGSLSAPIAVVFLVKVAFAFAVDHYRDAP